MIINYYFHFLFPEYHPLILLCISLHSSCFRRALWFVCVRMRVEQEAPPTSQLIGPMCNQLIMYKLPNMEC